MTRTASANSALRTIALGILVMVIMTAATMYAMNCIAVNNDGQTQVNRHAIERHGPDAIVAYAWTTLFGKHHKWDCPDGRSRTVTRMYGNTWAVSVENAAGELITAFTSTDRDYVKGIIDPCHNHWHYAHP